MWDLEIWSDDKLIAWLSSNNVKKLNTIETILEESGYEVKWGDEE